MVQSDGEQRSPDTPAAKDADSRPMAEDRVHGGDLVDDIRAVEDVEGGALDSQEVGTSSPSPTNSSSAVHKNNGDSAPADGNPEPKLERMLSAGVKERILEFKEKVAWKVGSSDGEGQSSPKEMTIFLSFQGRVKKDVWQGGTLITLQKQFMERFKFPEKTFHPFLYNKVKLTMSHRKSKYDPIISRNLESVAQLMPGCLIKAESDEWLAWHMHASNKEVAVVGLLSTISGSTKSIVKNRSDVAVHMSLSGRLHRLLNHPESGTGAFITSVIMNTVILLSGVIFCVETLPYFYKSTESKSVSANTRACVRTSIELRQTKPSSLSPTDTDPLVSPPLPSPSLPLPSFATSP